MRPAISRQSFERLARFITEELGIKMPETNVSLIQGRLLGRVRALGLQSIDEYCEHLFSSPDAAHECVHFIDAVTTNKTDFFREPKHFDYLVQRALPQLVQSERGLAGPLAVWSAACSSGEEPYTLAMILSEYAVGRPGFDFQILATDISTRVLDTARHGIYTRDQIAPVPKTYRHKYLLHGKADQRLKIRITPALRRRISFHRLNLMDADYGVEPMFHFIFCRNVLIYFDRPTQELVINKLCRNLAPGGYLFVSLTESLKGLNVPVSPLGHSIFQKCR